MALILGAAAFSAGCGDDSEGGGGTTASSTSATTGTGGAGGEGGSNEGGSNEGGAGTECVTCSAPLLGNEDPADLCESSVDEYEAVTTCICTECGAAEGDPCFDSCAGTAEQPSEECTACGVAAALTDGGACKAEGDACAADEGE
ncbi:hypothetical protein BE21_10040 [Sorangium cellulosum]|uniref:Secreted protein n=1 Tax=Sorangium cellulosum TaxID=56 RepID=A0A150U1G3_SORCE|nr:hypothetical protein BE21_10040 [Sorangium cellulosum]